MLPQLALKLPDSEDYLYEVKWDGYRALLRWDGRGVEFSSRNCIDLADRFPEITARHAALRQPLIVDGELVAMDRAGSPRHRPQLPRRQEIRPATLIESYLPDM